MMGIKRFKCYTASKHVNDLNGKMLKKNVMTKNLKQISLFDFVGAFFHFKNSLSMFTIKFQLVGSLHDLFPNMTV